MAIYVYGTSTSGNFANDYARAASAEYGADYKIIRGRNGNSYAIPYLDSKLNLLPIAAIKKEIDEFKQFCIDNPTELFIISPIVCYKKIDTHGLYVLPLFKDLPPNCFKQPIDRKK